MLHDYFHELARKVRNWGRWGVDDEIGTINLIDAEARRRGAASVKQGRHLVDMGMTQGQNWVLDTLAEDCAADGQYTFLLEASPQPVVGGVGSPVNPIAVK